MESLARLVAILVVIVVSFGPLALVLASNRVKGWSRQWIVVFWIRRLVVTTLAAVGATVATNFLFTTSVPTAQLIGLFGAITIITAMMWEFRARD